MKILYFNEFRLGLLNAERVIDVTDCVRELPHTGPHDLINALIEHFDMHDALRRTWCRETRLDRQNQGFDTPTPQLTGKYAPPR